jgi:hypothetical protein
MTPVKILFRHGFTRIFTGQIRKEKSVKIRVNPWLGSLRSAAGKRQQGDVPRLLDGQGQASLVRCTDSGQSTRNYLAALRHELGKQPDIFVVNSLDFLHAELANFLAAKIFAPAFTATRTAGTRGTTLSTIGPVAKRGTVTPGGPISTRGALPTRTSFRYRCCSHFFSHDAP